VQQLSNSVLASGACADHGCISDVSALGSGSEISVATARAAHNRRARPSNNQLRLVTTGAVDITLLAAASSYYYVLSIQFIRPYDIGAIISSRSIERSVLAAQSLGGALAPSTKFLKRA
jgi:hypothetical protein